MDERRKVIRRPIDVGGIIPGAICAVYCPACNHEPDERYMERCQCGQMLDWHVGGPYTEFELNYMR